MLRIFQCALMMGILALAAMGSTPKIGEPAPPFALPDTKGETIALKDYAGKSKVVLVFYRGYW